jgi:thiamine-monophosphate kinase
MVEGRHFRRDWARPPTSATAPRPQNLSDINAMGGRATPSPSGSPRPRDLPCRGRSTSPTGFAEECALVGAVVVGGDLTAPTR